MVWYFNKQPLSPHSHTSLSISNLRDLVLTSVWCTWTSWGCPCSWRNKSDQRDGRMTPALSPSNWKHRKVISDMSSRITACVCVCRDFMHDTMPPMFVQQDTHLHIFLAFQVLIMAYLGCMCACVCAGLNISMLCVAEPTILYLTLHWCFLYIEFKNYNVTVKARELCRGVDRGYLMTALWPGRATSSSEVNIFHFCNLVL